MRNGPQAYTHDERIQRAWDIAGYIQRHYGERTLAIGLYGSLARNADGPFSDIEMHVIIEGDRLERCFEWSAGPWKAEVDVYSPDVALSQAAEFDEFWPVTHGAFVHILPLHDPQDFFPHLREAALSHSGEQFRMLIAEVIIGEIYECVGKIRNAVALGRPESLAVYTLDAARYGACLVGLHNHRVYTSGPTVFSESLELPGRPEGYDELCRLVMAGELNQPERTAIRVDAFWNGIEAWAAGLGLAIQGDLEHLLASAS